MNEIYDIRVKTIKGEEIQLDIYKGKVLLIVNTASECGFTPQYAGLEDLYKKYKNKGLVVLGFPCNQFGAQEPGTELTIASSCLANYGVSFPMFSKINVNGDKEHELFTFLKKQQKGFLIDKIKWNFTKFLVDKSGHVIDRFAPTTKPQSIEKYILDLV